MIRFFFRTLVFSAAFFAGCVRPAPVLLPASAPPGEGDALARDLFRSFWLPPSADDRPLHVGIVPAAETVRFRALRPVTIRAFSAEGSWEVASPEKVIWRVDAGKPVRPAVTVYFATVDIRLFGPDQTPSEAATVQWKSRGYMSARWVGPPKMDGDPKRFPLERWILSLTPPAGKDAAEEICSRERKEWKLPCATVARVELPPRGSGTLTAENSTFTKNFDGFLEIVSGDGETEVLDVVPDERTGERNSERYGPRLFVVPGGDNLLNLVQAVTLENYLDGVVPAEIFPAAPAEALRAQAVVARTYAVRHAKAEDSARPFSICASTNCQVYRGAPYRRETSSAAVRDTKDLIVHEPDGAPAETFFHSICGGHTEPRSAVWGLPGRDYLAGVADQPVPFQPLDNDATVEAYLNGTPTSYCGKATLTKNDRWRWNAELDRAALEKIAAQVKLSPPLTDLRVLKRGVSGRALEIEFKTAAAVATVTGELAIRQLFGGLPSSLFVFSPIRHGEEIRSLKIAGGGYGHGVGLCQMGAVGRAEAGQTFREILSTYYPGTILAPSNASVLP